MIRRTGRYSAGKRPPPVCDPGGDPGEDAARCPQRTGGPLRRHSVDVAGEGWGMVGLPRLKSMLVRSSKEEFCVFCENEIKTCENHSDPHGVQFALRLRQRPLVPNRMPDGRRRSQSAEAGCCIHSGSSETQTPSWVGTLEGGRGQLEGAGSDTGRYQ